MSQPSNDRASGMSLERQPKTYGIFAMTLFAVSAIITLTTVAPSAAMGWQALPLYAIVAVAFFIPYGLVTAELGSAWPQEGGLYVWIREAFGQRWATFSAWMYWVNVAYWAPSVFVVFAGTILAAFWPSMSQTWAEVIVIVLIWVMVGVGILPMSLSKWVASLSAILKVLILVMIAAVGLGFALSVHSANTWAPHTWVPKFGATWSFLPVIVYNFMGFELMSSAAGAVKHPRRDVPRMILYGGVIIVVMYLLGNFGILSAIPLAKLSIVTGMAAAMKLSFHAVLGGAATAVYDLFVGLLLFTFIGNMVVWSIGANQSMGATGLDRAAPGVFGHTNRRFVTPDYAFVLMGLLATGLTIVNYSFFTTRSSVFWSIFALASIVFLITYLLMFPTLLVLRKKQPDTPRPYRVPGGKVGAWVSVGLAWAGVAFAIVLFFYLVPTGTPSVTYWAITGTGTAVSMLVGWWLAVRMSKNSTLSAKAISEIEPPQDERGAA